MNCLKLKMQLCFQYSFYLSWSIYEKYMVNSRVSFDRLSILDC